MLRDLWRQLADVWLDNLDASTVTGGKLMRDFQSGALSEIVNVCLECQAATSDIGIGMFLDQCGRPFNCPSNHRIVHFAAWFDQTREIRCRLDNEPGIDRDAVTTDSRAGAQDVDARMSIGEIDDLPHVNPITMADQRELVCKCDIGIAERVFGQLDHFGCARCRGDARASNKSLVKALRTPGAVRRYATNTTVIVDQLRENASGQDPLGAVGYRNAVFRSIGHSHRQIGTNMRDLLCYLFRRPDRNCRLQNYKIAGAQHPDNTVDRFHDAS